ncbi:MAG: phosphotransferase family protein, partial [Polyangiaceae bacterium]
MPGRRLEDAEPLMDGLRNANFKLTLGGCEEAFVLRIYEHDPSLCDKEADLRRLVGAKVPVPEAIHVEPRGLADLPPFAISRFVDGLTFRDLSRTRDQAAIGEAARSIGETLAAIGSFQFPRPGWLAPGPTVGPPLLE